MCVCVCIRERYILMCVRVSSLPEKKSKTNFSRYIVSNAREAKLNSPVLRARAHAVCMYTSFHSRFCNHIYAIRASKLNATIARVSSILCFPIILKL